MTLLLNGAGASAADPILKGLPIKVIYAASSFDVASIVDTWIEQNATIPGSTGSVKSSLSPAATVTTAGVTGSYNDTSKAYTISSTTGLSVGDYLYLSHASLTAGIYQILTIVNGTDVTLVSNPLNTLGNKTGISYQVAWTYTGNTATAPITSAVAGQVNYAKARFQDSLANNGDLSDLTYVRDAPAGSGYIAIGGVSYTGAAVSTLTPTFGLLSGWTNNGGVSHVELANHSVQAVNNFQWGDSTVTEKTIAAAETSGLKLSAGDGLKYGRLLLKTKSGGTALGIDIDIRLDTTGPTVLIFLAGA